MHAAVGWDRSNRMRWFAFLGIAAASLLAMGCSTPSVSLKNAAVRGAEVDGLRFDAMLEVHNPNNFDVQVRAVRANVHVENVAAPLPVIVSPNVWVRANTKAMVAVPIKVPWGAVPRILATTVSQSTVGFRVAGNADVTATSTFQIRQDGYRFNEEGELPRGIFLRLSTSQPVTVGSGRDW